MSSRLVAGAAGRSRGIEVARIRLAGRISRDIELSGKSDAYSRDGEIGAMARHMRLLLW
jgi:hypothetical protein